MATNLPKRSVILATLKTGKLSRHAFIGLSSQSDLTSVMERLVGKAYQGRIIRKSLDEEYPDDTNMTRQADDTDLWPASSRAIDTVLEGRESGQIPVAFPGLPSSRTHEQADSDGERSDLTGAVGFSHAEAAPRYLFKQKRKLGDLDDESDTVQDARKRRLKQHAAAESEPRHSGIPPTGTTSPLVMTVVKYTISEDRSGGVEDEKARLLGGLRQRPSLLSLLPQRWV
ncbi:hypothetical protein A1O3_04054 [Capronia epimyces CBS 606.96]|uniref:Uncharacterized protein n=1 Tax=Capronia epimyces CBS 606.96 TaxID=1182542 RepID=W9YCW3_9EURO|nr:uncharacterized protein A1O3_04054 [Capronia epimyces CBS 606.96]EXJ87096.1 hypothetical protein A1O3_04054 [Capronia epimyces CBS 606.96]